MGLMSSSEETTAADWFTLKRAGKKGSPILFVSGPPTSGAIFERVQERLAPRRTVAIEGIADPSSFDPERFAVELQRLCDVEEVRVVVAHGLALPLVLKSNLQNLDLLIVSNGPVGKLDLFTRTLSRMPRIAMEKALLRPGVFNKWLASSVGLRRAVVNPYVMDRETVQSLSHPYLSTIEARKMTARWLKELPGLLPVSMPSDTKVVAIWGDLDSLYPVEEINKFQVFEIFLIPGGRFLHPQERPWELADACIEIIEKSVT